VKKALVIHPILSGYAGGELLCLHVCQALLHAGYEVQLFSDTNDPAKADQVYPGLGHVLAECSHISSASSHRSIPGIGVVKDFKEIREAESVFQKIGPEVAFSTQSSVLHVPCSLYHFVYHGAHLFQHSVSYLPSAFPKEKLPLGYARAKRTLNDSVKKILRVVPPTPTWYFAISPGILRSLRSEGHWNSSLLPPPCTQFRPREKRDQVVQVTRLIPEKRVEIFLEAARMLPQYPFILIARTKPGLEAYARDILDKIPPNLTVVNSSLRQVSHLLEESKVYVYTGSEGAMMLTVPEAISAGCYPIASRNTGPAETLETVGVGVLFDTIEDLVPAIQQVMRDKVNARELSEKARVFSPERFEERVADIAVHGVAAETCTKDSEPGPGMA
jgi:glycosyltransferase involved in cell wall biosynthesis